MNTEKALLRIEEAAEVLGVSRARAYAMAASGQLPIVMLGRSRRVPVRQLSTWIEERVIDVAPLMEGVAASRDVETDT